MGSNLSGLRLRHPHLKPSHLRKINLTAAAPLPHNTPISLRFAPQAKASPPCKARAGPLRGRLSSTNIRHPRRHPSSQLHPTPMGPKRGPKFTAKKCLHVSHCMLLNQNAKLTAEPAR